jgi:hypothetical protein
MADPASDKGCRGARIVHVFKRNVRVLAALAGNSNISTAQRYIEVGEHQLRAAVEVV